MLSVASTENASYTAATKSEVFRPSDGNRRKACSTSKRSGTISKQAAVASVGAGAAADVDVGAEKHVLLQMNNSESKVHKVFMPTVVEDPPESCPLKDARCFAALQMLCSKKLYRETGSLSNLQFFSLGLIRGVNRQ